MLRPNGIAAARLRGVHLGRYANPIPDSFFPVFERWEQRKLTGKEAAAELGMTYNQFEWLKRKYKKMLKADTAHTSTEE